VLAEFGLDTVVLIADLQGNLLHELTVADLLPHAFGEADLDAARD
jgi:cytidine deaminase